MTTISLKLPDHLLTALESAAKARRVTKSQIVRESLEQSLRGVPGKRHPSAYDLAADLAGCLEGGPPDLATNPKYMDGFGE